MIVTIGLSPVVYFRSGFLTREKDYACLSVGR